MLPTSKKYEFQMLLRNVVPLYRLLAFPLILYFMVIGNQNLFALLVVFNFVVVILDGFITRILTAQTRINHKLDFLGETGTYVLAFTGILLFKAEVMQSHLLSLFTTMLWVLILILLSLFSSDKNSGFHLHTFKTGGYIRALFFVSLFFHGFIASIYYLMITWTLIACLEYTLSHLILPVLNFRIKKLYIAVRYQEQKQHEPATGSLQKHK